MDRWVRIVAVMAGVVIGAGLGADSVAQEATGGETAAAQEGGLDRATRDRIRGLRRQLGLANEDLAALGCSQVDAKEVLGALRTWYETNEAALASARAAEATAKAALRDALRKVRIGPRDQALLTRLPALKTAYGSALRQRYDLVKTAVPAVEAKLTASQKSLWRAVRKSSGLPRKYRYVPDITTAQSQTLRVAHRTRVRLLAAAKTGAEMKAAEAAFAGTEQRTLSAGQREAIATAKANVRLLLAGVEAASKETFPVATTVESP